MFKIKANNAKIYLKNDSIYSAFSINGTVFTTLNVAVNNRIPIYLYNKDITIDKMIGWADVNAVQYLN